MLHANLMALSSIESDYRSYGHSKFYFTRRGIFDLYCSSDVDLDLMTFILTHISWRYTRYANMNYLYVKAFERYRLTDRQTDRHDQNYIGPTTPLRGWSTRLSRSGITIQHALLHFSKLIAEKYAQRQINYLVGKCTDRQHRRTLYRGMFSDTGNPHSPTTR